MSCWDLDGFNGGNGERFAVAGSRTRYLLAVTRRLLDRYATGATTRTAAPRPPRTKERRERRSFPQSTVGGGCLSQPAAKSRICTKMSRDVAKKLKPFTAAKEIKLSMDLSESTPMFTSITRLLLNSPLQFSYLQWSTLHSLTRLNICQWGEKKKKKILC